MKSHKIKILIFITTCLLASSLLVGTSIAQQQNNLPVVDISNETANSLNSPTGDSWNNIEKNEISLSGAPSAPFIPLVDTEETRNVTTDTLNVKAAKTSDRIYFHLSWEDPTKNIGAPNPPNFPDAGALQMPSQPGKTTSIMMGSQNIPVNIWYKSAGKTTEEIIAAGPGSVSSLNQSVVKGNMQYKNGRWQLVLYRTLEASGNNKPQFSNNNNNNYDIAFAVWNGANKEKDGKKAISTWYTLNSVSGQNQSTGGQPAEQQPGLTFLTAIFGIVSLFILRKIRNRK